MALDWVKIYTLETFDSRVFPWRSSVQWREKRGTLGTCCFLSETLFFKSAIYILKHLENGSFLKRRIVMEIELGALLRLSLYSWWGIVCFLKFSSPPC